MIGPVEAAGTAGGGDRDLVLRHPEIARRLTEPPIGYARPEQWNGYVPPVLWREQLNDSPQRMALLDLIAAARQAETEV